MFGGWSVRVRREGRHRAVYSLAVGPGENSLMHRRLPMKHSFTFAYIRSRYRGLFDAPDKDKASSKCEEVSRQIDGAELKLQPPF